MCLPVCRDPRAQDPAVAAEVYAYLATHGIEPVLLSRWLIRTWHVRRFEDLCWSHASGVLEGLTKSILADEVTGAPNPFGPPQRRPHRTNPAHT